MTRTRSAGVRLAAACLASALIAGGVAGCGGTAATPEPSPVPAAEVVTTDGLGTVRFGSTRTELERDAGMVQRPGDCQPRLPDHPSASPVFDQDRLVLLWADPPLRTPAELGVGVPTSRVRQAHPDAEELTAPPGSFQFDGLLVPGDGDRAYLFLHDRQQVQKLIVGYERHARLLFTEGFGTC